MTTIYFTFYDLSDENRKYQVEHQKGLELLCKGLNDLYNIYIDHNSISNFIDFHKHGKPYLKNYHDIHFNISHCDGLVACAFSNKEIGLDIERVTNCKDLLIKKVLTENEQNYLTKYQNEEEYKEMFFRFWTLKECYMKWDGSGFFKEPKSISFEFDLNKDKIRIQCSDSKVNFYQEKILNDCICSICSENTIQNENIEIRWI